MRDARRCRRPRGSRAQQVSALPDDACEVGRNGGGACVVQLGRQPAGVQDSAAQLLLQIGACQVDRHPGLRAAALRGRRLHTN